MTTAATTTRDRRHVYFVVALVMVFIAMAGQYAVKATRNRSAFLRWREQILQMDGGTNIYQTYNYPNPPIMALMLRPLAELPPVTGAMVWFVLKCGMALVSLLFVFRMVEGSGLAFPLWAKGAVVILSLRAILGDLSHGNVNLFILWLVASGLYALYRERPWLAGALIALSICCKVTPALFVPYFLWKRQWRVLAGVAAGGVLFAILIPGMALGQRENLVQLRSWCDNMVLPFLRDGVVTAEHHNQSLPGYVNRLFTRNPSFVTYPNGVWTPAEYHNVADIGATGAKWIIRAFQALFAAMVIWLCRATVRGGGWRLMTEYAMIVVGMLLFSERTWKHHAVTLIVPFAVLMYVVALVPHQRWVKLSVAGVLTVATGLMLTASGMLSTRAADLAMVYGVYTYAFLILMAALGIVVAIPVRESRSQTIEPPVTIHKAVA
jgi:hypothetical protein